MNDSESLISWPMNICSISTSRIFLSLLYSPTLSSAHDLWNQISQLSQLMHEVSQPTFNWQYPHGNRDAWRGPELICASKHNRWTLKVINRHGLVQFIGHTLLLNDLRYVMKPHLACCSRDCVSHVSMVSSEHGWSRGNKLFAYCLAFYSIVSHVMRCPFGYTSLIKQNR